MNSNLDNVQIPESEIWLFKKEALRRLAFRFGEKIWAPLFLAEKLLFENQDPTKNEKD